MLCLAIFPLAVLKSVERMLSAPVDRETLELETTLDPQHHDTSQLGDTEGAVRDRHSSPASVVIRGKLADR